MKAKRHRNSCSRFWQRFVKGPAPAHDRFLSLSITRFNLSTGWERLLQKQQFGA